jgi:hypothetical protein
VKARDTIKKARYFLSRARQAEVEVSVLAERLPFEANLEAAIVYARASIEHVKAELAPIYNDRGYRTWHDTTWRRFRDSDQVFRYLYERRNFILHQEPETTTAQVNLEASFSINMSVSLSMTITRGDGSTETRVSSAETPAKEDGFGSTQSQHFLFQDRDWRTKPATVYVEEFIALCERFMVEAEGCFIYPAP